MKDKVISVVRNFGFIILVLAVSFLFGTLFYKRLDMPEHISTIFVFGVFVISLITDGYVYGIVSTVASIVIINYVFKYPFNDFDFTTPANMISAIIMLIVTLLTSTLTTKLKKWQALKAEGEREKMRANLLRAVSHDLRTPLTTIYGASSSILENYDNLTDAQKKQLVGGIKEDSEWLIRMVENLLSITRINSGEVKLLKSPTVLEELIDASILKFRKTNPDCDLDIVLPDDIVVIPMDALLIEQVIVNILENVVHHAKGFTKIQLKVTSSGNAAVFEISDDGCGISKDRLEHIFTGGSALPEDNGDSKVRNAGIGLSVCATIINAHGGSIAAHNGKNGGAVFRFTLATEETADE